MKRFLVLFLLALFLSSCMEDDLVPTYHGVNNIYFATTVEQQGNIQDSIFVSFALRQGVTDSLIKVPVRVMGIPADINRPYKVSITNKSTAKEGVHFDFNESDCIIPSGELVDSIKITLHRTSDLKSDTVSLYLKLRPNKYFSTKMKYKVVNGDTIGFTSFRIYSTDVLTKPDTWIKGFLGIFSPKKFHLMEQILTINLSRFRYPFGKDKAFSISEITKMAVKMQRYLNKRAKHGNSVMVTVNGKKRKMRMGPQVQ